VKAGPQNRWQSLFGLKNGYAKTDDNKGSSWGFNFDNGSNVTENDRLKASLSLLASEGAEPASSTNPLERQAVGDDQWHHVAYTFAPNANDAWKTDYAMFVDHKKVASKTGCDGRVNLAEGGYFYIAVDSRAANKFTGVIDEIRITRGVLAPEQFLKLRRVRGGVMLIIR
jgi:hypothetical protein